MKEAASRRDSVILFRLATGWVVEHEKSYYDLHERSLDALS